MVCSPEIMRPCPLRAVLSKYYLLPYRCTALLIRGALYFLEVVLSKYCPRPLLQSNFNVNIYET